MQARRDHRSLSDLDSFATACPGNRVCVGCPPTRALLRPNRLEGARLGAAMYPVLFEIGNFSISTFGLMVAVGFLAGTHFAATLFQENGENPDHATTIMLYAMVGGILGAKIYYSIDFAIRTDSTFWSLFWQRAGMTFYGGLIGGTVASILGSRIHKVPLWLLSQAVAPAMAMGQAFGRIGCFLVGDDYGYPTDLPWGVAFPEGAPPIDVPVHPTQLYESFWLFLVFGYLWKRRKRSPFLFGEYMMLNGFGRFFVEILRLNPKLALGLTQSQWIAILLIAVGASLWLWFHARRSRTLTQS